MKFGVRIPSFKKRIAARTSWKRVVRHNLGLKAPRGWGWLTNPRKAAYNRVYNRTTFSLGSLGGRSRGSGTAGGSGSSSDGCGCAFLLIVGLAVVGLASESARGLLVLAVVIGIVASVLTWRDAGKKEAQRKARRLDLIQRFGEQNAEAILTGRYWLGATSEMILESLGQPADIKERVLKTKTKHTFCYNPLGKNRYALKIHLEDTIVVGWDDT